MTSLDWLELTGTVAFFMFSIVCAYLSIHVERFTRYGQEALLASAAALFTAGLMRLLVLTGQIERETAIIVNSLTAIAVLILGAQLAVMRIVHSYYARRVRP